MLREPFARRRARLLRLFDKSGVEALLVTRRENVRYLSGFRGDDSALLVTPASTSLLTDGRYVEQAGQETRRVRVLCRKGGLMPFAGQCARKAQAAALGVEAGHMTLAASEALRDALGSVRLVATHGLVEGLRRVKDREEVAAIRRAISIAEEAFRQTFKAIRPGMTELEIARKLEYALLDLGAEAPAFPSIVAVQERSSLPHAIPSARKVRRGEAILFDWGARVEGYHSDLTRMVFLDRIPPHFRRLHDLVLRAQERAIRRIRPGVAATSVNASVREFFRAHRCNRLFSHGLGHGIGLVIHEAPSLGDRGEGFLKPGMVCTVEPGLYVPGRGGVRIEDDVLVTRTGCTVLTALPRRPDAFLKRFP